MQPFGDGEKKPTGRMLFRPAGFYAWPDRDFLVAAGNFCLMNLSSAGRNRPGNSLR